MYMEALCIFLVDIEMFYSVVEKTQSFDMIPCFCFQHQCLDI